MGPTPKLDFVLSSMKQRVVVMHVRDRWLGGEAKVYMLCAYMFELLLSGLA